MIAATALATLDFVLTIIIGAAGIKAFMWVLDWEPPDVCPHCGESLRRTR